MFVEVQCQALCTQALFLQISEAEWREVTGALMRSNDDLRDGGYQGHGHF